MAMFLSDMSPPANVVQGVRAGGACGSLKSDRARPIGGSVKNILIVDDSPVVRREVSAVLRSAGFVVFEAVDGQDGAEKIAATPSVSIVICDLNMPRLGGIELLEKVLPARPDLPVVMLTTENNPDLVTRARRAGAKGWLIKPFKPASLLATVRKLVG
jgi:two-component system, chemotaxis family, chemotaxis protein CheY